MLLTTKPKNRQSETHSTQNCKTLVMTKASIWLGRCKLRSAAAPACPQCNWTWARARRSVDGRRPQFAATTLLYSYYAIGWRHSHVFDIARRRGVRVPWWCVGLVAGRGVPLTVAIGSMSAAWWCVPARPPTFPKWRHGRVKLVIKTRFTDDQRRTLI